MASFRKIEGLAAVKDLERWLGQYARENGLVDENGQDTGRYTLAHFADIQEKARELGLEVDSNGVITELNTPVPQ